MQIAADKRHFIDRLERIPAEDASARAVSYTRPRFGAHPNQALNQNARA